MIEQLTRKRRKRNLRRCNTFKRGKCVTCEKPDTDGQECDMKKAGNEHDRKDSQQ
jgi:hypothetical protein